ncbi:MAG TPA: heme biosynthesis HemY N-terminal domain-containing protein [Gammaproteobacteria bacterium]|nr:heme biosynthesis HemY N-terminal domain-containing protein [Gammaproteobacteria bacterium]
MYFIVLLFLTILTLIGLGYFSLAHLDVAILVGTDGFRYDIKLWLLVLISLAVVAAIYAIIQCVIVFFNLPNYIRTAHKNHRLGRAEKLRNSALQELSLGCWEEAEYSFNKASNYVDSDLDGLVAASCAVHAGRFQQAKQYLNQIQLPEYERWFRDVLELDCMVYLDHLESALDRGLYMVKETGEPATVRRLLLICYKLDRWDAMLEHLNLAVTWFNRHLDHADTKVWVRSLLTTLIAYPAEFKRTYRMLNFHLQKDSMVESLNAKFIGKTVSVKAKLEYIENISKGKVQAIWVDNYAEEIMDPARMLKVALGWQEKEPGMPEIHRLIARCNREQAVWEAAFQHYHKAIQINKDSSVALECLDMLVETQQFSNINVILSEFKS